MRQRSAGVLLYRKDGDLLLALTKVLIRERHQTHKVVAHAISNSSRDTVETATESEAVWEKMNRTIHTQIHVCYFGKASRAF